MTSRDGLDTCPSMQYTTKQTQTSSLFKASKPQFMDFKPKNRSRNQFKQQVSKLSKSPPLLYVHVTQHCFNFSCINPLHYELAVVTIRHVIAQYTDFYCLHTCLPNHDHVLTSRVMHARYQ